MKAYRLFDWKTRPRLVDVPQPTAGPNQVLVKVGGNGLCDSDLHPVDDLCCAPSHLDIELPMTLGHEVAGWVQALGQGVRGFEIGQPCVITIVGCWQCDLCAQGWNNYCRARIKQVGMGADDGFASDDRALEQILEATGGAGVHAVLDFVGVNASIQLGRQCIRPLGHIVLVGRGGGSIDFGPRRLPYGACISSTFGGSKLELMELLALAAAGRIECRIERHPLSQVDRIFDKLRRNEVIGRAVILPDGH